MHGKIACLLTAAVFLSACATFRPAEGLDVSVANLQLGESTLMETTLQVTVRLANATPDPLLLEGGVHRVYLNGLYVGEGLNNETLEVPRLSSVTQTVATHLENLRLITRIRGIFDSRKVDYRILSTVYVRQNGRRQTFRIARDGTLDLQQFAPIPATPSLRMD